MTSSLFHFRSQVNEKMLRHDNARYAFKEERRRNAEAKKFLSDAEEARSIIQHIAQEAQETAHSRIAAVVSKCLRAVFDDPYEFKIHFEQKRGKTEARLVFCRDGEEVNPIDAAGGGMVDVASFSLRISSIVMSRPRLRRFIAFDEPFRFVSEEYWDSVREMLETISREMGIQILQITHNNELKTGKLFHIGD